MNNALSKYTKINKNSLKGFILIQIREQYVIQLAKLLLDTTDTTDTTDTKHIKNIVPLEYIDKNIRLQCIIQNKPIIINYDKRLEYLTNILSKECAKGTASIISNMCS